MTFIETVKTIIEEFIQKVDAIVDVVAKERERLQIYNTQEMTRRMSEVEETSEKLALSVRQGAFEKLDNVFIKAKSFFSVAVAEIDTEEIFKLKTIFDISHDKPAAFIVEILLDSVNGDYWGLSFLADRLDDGTAGGILNAPARPDIPQYFLILDEIEGACKSFVSSYTGKERIAGQATDVSALLIQNEGTWNRWRERIDTICPLFVTDRTLLQGALTSSQRNQINELIPIGKSNIEKVELVKRYGENPYYQGLLLRSQYSDIIEEMNEENKAKEIKKIVEYTPFEGAFLRWSDIQESKKWKH